MLRRQDHEGGAIQCVRPRGENFNDCLFLLLTLDHKIHFGAVTFADPVFLHGDDPLRPATLQVFETVQQSVGVFGDLEEPGFLLFLLDWTVASPATVVDHLLVG